ncbi:hypothetical protein A3762_10545 [Oleiphilus sp. HI0125]|nr:hypothetical protein A3762_10545 [Oleiphilus sp. HI0125]
MIEKMSISSEARLCLALSQIQGFGLKQFHLLREQYGNPSSWRKLSFDALNQCISKPKVSSAVLDCLAQADHSLNHVSDWLKQDGCSVVCYFDSPYPEVLRQIHLAPALLYLKGNIGLLNHQNIAVVGSRKPSLQYADIAQEYAFHLAKSGMSIVSGLALGVDTKAHLGALAAQGNTIAVLATGIDRCYPAKNKDLYELIAQEGLLVSEMPLGSAPLRHNFPRRNRIVSGLSRAVLVVEAGIKSGSLITARYAIEQNRDVYAVPGSPKSLNSQGCNYLIREGARLVGSIEDLIIDLHKDLNVSGLTLKGVADSAHDEAQNVSDAAQLVLSAVGSDTISFDDLFERLEMSFEHLSEHLLELELAGLISSVSGGYQLGS